MSRLTFKKILQVTTGLPSTSLFIIDAKIKVIISRKNNVMFLLLLQVAILELYFSPLLSKQFSEASRMPFSFLYA